MRYKLLGCTGLRISELCLGAMTFGAPEWEHPPTSALGSWRRLLRPAATHRHCELLRRWRERTHRRPADRRGPGAVGAIDEIHALDAPARPKAGGTHRRSLVQALKGSLRRLRRDDMASTGSTSGTSSPQSKR